MPTDYQRKYIECVKVYHKLHAELSGITMKLTSRLRDMDIPAQYKSSLSEVLFEGADRIREVDITFRDLVRTNWTPPEERDELLEEGRDHVPECNNDGIDWDYDEGFAIAGCTPSPNIIAP